MRKAIQYYIKAENFITNVLMVGVVIFVFAAAAMRWVGSPIAWSVEFAQFLFVWVIFLGANRALREERHIGVDFFTKKLSRKFQGVLEIIVLGLVMLFLGYLTYYGTLLSLENSLRRIGNIPLSYSFVTMAVPVGSILMIATIISKLKKKLLAPQNHKN